MPPIQDLWRRARRFLFSAQGALLLAVLALTFFLNTYRMDEPTWHTDEERKVQFVTEANRNFYHPLLMRRFLALGSQIMGAQTPEEILLHGHQQSAFFGMLIALVMFFFARRFLDWRYALMVALGVGIAPTMVIHAHYLKEDVPLTLLLLTTLAAYRLFLKRRTPAMVLLLGLLGGLAISTHYKGLMLPLMFLGFPLIIRVENLKRYYAQMAGVFLSGMLVFAGVNDLIHEYNDINDNATYEYNRARKGHKKLKIDALSQGFTFHLRNSVIPGTSLPLTVLAMVSMLVLAARWRTLHPMERLLLAFTAAFYLVPEISPRKPFPDYSRYVLPMIPFVIYFAARGAYLLRQRVPQPARVPVDLAFLALILLMLSDTVPLLQQWGNDDTRQRLISWQQQADAKGVTYLAPRIAYDDQIDLQELHAQDIDYLIIDSTVYDRFLISGHLPNQHEGVYAVTRQIESLFTRPYTEIKPAFKGFAFSNPTIRIIDIRPESAPLTSLPANR